MMTQKVINQDLLWQAIVWVQYSYACLPEPEQLARPQRPYQPGDGKMISPLVSNLRAAYYAAKVKNGVKANFDSCKKMVMNCAQDKHGWSDATRNFYSSVIATYVTWDFRKISAANQRTLRILTPLMKYIQQKPEGQCHEKSRLVIGDSDSNQSLAH